jgi:hypothetical protein
LASVAQDAIKTRLFPRLWVRAADAGDGLTGPAATLASALVQLGRANLGTLGRLMGIGLESADRVRRLLRYLDLAIDAELTGKLDRADFFWHEVHRQMDALAKHPQTWKTAVEAVAERAGVPLPLPPEQMFARFTKEVIVDSHGAFLCGWSGAKVSWARQRVVAHLAWIRRVIAWTDLRQIEQSALLGPPTIAEIEACERDGDWKRAETLANDLLLRFPETTAYQNIMADVYHKRAISYSVKNNKKGTEDGATVIAQATYRLKKLRQEYPHNLYLFQRIAELHLLRAQRLSTVGRLSEALADAQAATIYQPSVAESEATLVRLEAEMQALRVQAAQPETERPALSKRQFEQLQREAAQGLRLADAFRRSDEARSVAEDLPVALGRQAWEEADLGPLERYDLRPLALFEALETIQHDYSENASQLAELWSRVAQDNPHLAALHTPSVLALLQKRLCGTTSQVLGEEATSTWYTQAEAPPVLSETRQSSFPWLYWLCSRQDRRLKLQCVVAVLLVVIAAGIAFTEYSRRHVRSAAYSHLRQAYDRREYTEVLDAAERFLSLPIHGADSRITDVERLYSESFVRWFTEHAPTSDEAEGRAQRFRALLKLPPSELTASDRGNTQ